MKRVGSPQRLKRYLHKLIVTLILLQCALLFPSLQHSSILANAENASKGNDENNANAGDESDWGTFYDPKSLFCGKYDCYKILGFDYMTFDKVQPSKKDITKNYRSLSRMFHPDKSRAQGAKEKFVMIARAYEVLTDKKRKKEYDYFRDRPDEYLSKYGSSVIWEYAPKSDVRFIVILLLVCASIFTWFAQLSKWRTIADHLTKAAVEDLGRREGGSNDSAELRRKALDIWTTEEEARQEAMLSNGDSKKAKKGPKLTKQEKKKEQNEALRSIVVELVNKIDDFGGGFRKPNWRDIFVVKCLYLPVGIYHAVSWGIIFYSRRIRGLPYSDLELEVMTKRAVGRVAWDCCDEEEHEEMKKLELWVSKNLEEWKDEQELKNLSVGDRKKEARMRKRMAVKND